MRTFWERRGFARTPMTFLVTGKDCCPNVLGSLASDYLRNNNLLCGPGLITIPSSGVRIEDGQDIKVCKGLS